ncbi:lysosomal alpha-glucosidase-like [Haliotis rufescens]|uniref:lysosomal alpha-glucosidase-like n=1 Tax=Haliotis rufescens TaxID=6454 RepID=UPI00201F2655|nr:lysosomal alpha-glucosidase-like [Haliotis rufescens]
MHLMNCSNRAVGEGLLEGQDLSHQRVCHREWPRLGMLVGTLILATVLLLCFSPAVRSLLYLDYPYQPDPPASTYRPPGSQEDTGRYQREALEWVGRESEQCDVTPSTRLDCHPERNLSHSTCQSRGCCWNQGDGLSPPCFFPANYPRYTIVHKQNTGSMTTMELYRNATTHYPKDVHKLTVSIVHLSATALRIRITDATSKRWEVPINGSSFNVRTPDTTAGANGVQTPQTQQSEMPDTDKDLYIVDTPGPQEPFAFNIQRKSSGASILQTLGPLLFADQFLQVSYSVPSTFLYGLGEHRDAFMHSFNWTRFVMWNRGTPPVEHRNLYGSHPFYLMMEEDGSSHGVLLLNSNALEVMLQPAPAVTWRAIGGILDFYVFLGPDPDDVIQQYTQLIGRSFMPPYWGLGFHVCRYGYNTANRTRQVLERIRDAGVPVDVQWNDIDYMDDLKDFTTSPTFGDQAGLVDYVHSLGMHYVIITDPGISNTQPAGSYAPYDLGMKMGIFIRNSDNDDPLVSKVWPGDTVFPDFTHPDSQLYWTLMVKNFHDKVQFDGIWLDMNDISSFVDGSVTGCTESNTTYDDPPYLPAVYGDRLYTRTICTSSRHHWSRNYNIHNMYGLTETNATYQALKAVRKGHRPFIISRSTFPGQGHYGGHWSGDNAATYWDMNRSISEILSFSLFGVPLVGADICGFMDNTTEALCQRWYQLGAFYPFSRVHNNKKAMDQDPGAFSPALASSTRKALLTRYSLLPYLYTLFHKSSGMGQTVVRPLFFEFPGDRATYSVDTQFLWGPALMVLPVLSEGGTSVTVYLPDTPWYDFYTGKQIPVQGTQTEIDAPLDVINVLLRSGYILPLQQPATTTTQSRRNPFWLVVALNATGGAEGDLFWDDGDTLDAHERMLFNMLWFYAANRRMYSELPYIGLKEETMVMSNVTVFGVETNPSTVTVNGISVPFSYNTNNKVLMVTDLVVNLLKVFNLSWDA